MTINVVITGAAGYIGSKLTAYFLNKGYHVTAFDNYFYNQQSLTENVFYHNNCTFFEEDVTDWSLNLYNAIDSADVIIPLAALVGAPLCDKYPDIAYRVNEEWFETLVKNIDEQLVIYPNTNSGYGSTGKEICTEDTPCNPISLYGQTKGNAEQILINNHAYSICFRLATVFGKSYRQRTDLLVNNLILEAMTKHHIDVFDGHFRRNYIHIDDIVSAFDHAINHAIDMVGGVYNLGNDTINTTKLELVQKICNKMNCSYDIITNRTDPDKRDYIVSSQKLYNTGYVPIRDLDYGIVEMADLYSNIWNHLQDPDFVDKCRNY